MPFKVSFTPTRVMTQSEPGLVAEAKPSVEASIEDAIANVLTGGSATSNTSSGGAESASSGGSRTRIPVSDPRHPQHGEWLLSQKPENAPLPWLGYAAAGGFVLLALGGAFFWRRKRAGR